MAGSGFSFSPLDLAIIAFYAAVTLGKGIWLARSRTDTAEEHFLAGRIVVWPLVGISLIANLPLDDIRKMFGFRRFCSQTVG